VIGAGGKGYFFAAIPRRDFDTSRLCREFVVVGFAQFESRSQVNEKNKRRLPQLRGHGIPQREVENAPGGLVFIF
jgi:hypothetical protein